MAPHTFVFTNSPYTLSQISLASFVPNLQQPHQDAECTYQVQESDYDSQNDENFDLVLSSSSESRLKAVATKFASIFGSKGRDDRFQVQASKGRIYSLKQPDALFRKIVSGDNGIAETQRWLEDCKLRGLTPRFVVAFRTLVDARWATSESEDTAFGARITAPVGEALGGDPTGTVDLTGEASRESTKETQGGMRTPGERIYAISYRNVKLTYRRGKVTASLPSLENAWECFAAPRGDMEVDDGVHEEDNDDDVYVKADLQKGDDVKSYQVYLIPKPCGDAEAFGILAHDET